MVLYSIGHQRIRDVKALIKTLKENEIKILLDVRSKPYSRWNPGFNRKNLEAALPSAGIRYKWVGKSLGGFSSIAEKTIKELASWQKEKVVCLMCMEADPDKCHRKYEIAKRLETYGIIVKHIIITKGD